MGQQEKLKFIDGIKAIATVMVFNIHFLNAYYCGIYTLNPEHFHTANGVEWFIGATPLNLVYAGKLGARIFLVLSAFLLSRRYFMDHKEGNSLTRSAVKKYFRLVLPILAVNILVALIMAAGAYNNAEAAVLANSAEFFGSYNQFVPNIAAAVREAVWGCFVSGSNSYNGPLWFIYYEFWGCLLVAAVLSLVGRAKARYLIYLAAAVLFIRSDFLGMILGMVVADLVYTKKSYIERFTKRKWLMWLLFAIGFYFATYPSYGDNLQGSIYAIFPPKVLFYYNVAIPAMLFAILQLKSMQKILEGKMLEKFNKISFCFYLIHFPILCTVSSSFFTAMYGKINYHLLALLNYTLTFAASMMIAWLLMKLTDRPGQKMAEKITDKLVC